MQVQHDVTMVFFKFIVLFYRFKEIHSEVKREDEEVMPRSACLKATTVIEITRNNSLQVKTENNQL